MSKLPGYYTELGKTSGDYRNTEFTPETAAPPYRGQKIREVAFGTGGELAGDIFVYEIPDGLVRPGMAEDEARFAAEGAFGAHYAPMVRDFADKEGSDCEVHPADKLVWTPDGDIMQRDDRGEPCHILQSVARSVGTFVLTCLNHESSSEATYATSQAALLSGWRCPVLPGPDDY
jgi:hypothetical protein